jgi:hypothetical protein
MLMLVICIYSSQIQPRNRAQLRSTTANSAAKSGMIFPIALFIFSHYHCYPVFQLTKQTVVWIDSDVRSPNSSFCDSIWFSSSEYCCNRPFKFLRRPILASVRDHWDLWRSLYSICPLSTAQSSSSCSPRLCWHHWVSFSLFRISSPRWF